MTEQVKIPARNLPMVEQSIEKLNKRAEKYGLSERLTLKEISRDWEQVEAALTGGRVGSVEMLVLTVEGDCPTISGYRCLATLEVIEGDLFIHPMTSADVPHRHRNPATGRDCEHCNYERKRNETYVLERLGDTIQVGSSCLEDFTGDSKAKLFMKWASIMAAIRKVLVKAEKLSPNDTAFTPNDTELVGPDLAHYLGCCVAEAEVGGFEAKGKGYGRCTADRAWDNMWDNDFTSAEHRLKAAQIIAYVRNDLGEKDENKLSDYEHNLVAACRHDWVNPKLRYFVASSISAFMRAHEETPSYDPGFIGVKGTKERLIVEVVGSFVFRGRTTVIKMIDIATKRAVVYFSNRKDQMKVGGQYVLTAQINKHDRFRGVDTTTITKVEEVTEYGDLK